MNPIRVLVPFAVMSIAVLAAAGCSSAGAGDGVDPSAASASEQQAQPTTWGYLAGVDHGIRVQLSGAGWFSAPRVGGRMHAGIDFDLPVGTALRAPCDGEFRTGSDAAGYGDYVIVGCRVPGSLVGNGTPVFVSMIFGHLSETRVAGYEGQVTRGQAIGNVGKTGNAHSASIRSHVHFGMTAVSSMTAALSEHHSWGEHAENHASRTLVSALKDNCMTPKGFHSAHAIHQGRLIDPFVVLACLGDTKPPYTQKGAERWSEYYSADAFNVDTWIDH